MRLAILMPISSPWARSAALSLRSQISDVFVIDFVERHLGYLNQADLFLKDELTCFSAAMSGVHRIAWPFRSKIGYFLCFPQLRNILRSIRADILLVLYAGGFATMAFLSNFRPYVLYTVGSDVLLLGRTLKGFSRRALARASLVLANGEYLASRTQELAPRARVKPLLLGVDTELFCPITVESSPVRIVCTRGFEPLYNNEYLLVALSLLGDLAVPFEVIFCSKGSSLESARAYARKALPPQIHQRVRFLGGVAKETLISTLQSSHIYVSLSLSDGTSTSLLEALSCGLFPILSDIPPNREWINKDHSNGFLTPLGQPQILADLLRQAIVNSSLRDRAGTFNRSQVLERANSETNMEILTDHLEGILINGKY